ncbi:MAG TPA: archease [Actinomycetota bacterium]|jgi:SHS2 domain-containing protein
MTTDRDVGAGFQLLEHPADLGIRAWGPTIEAAYEQAGWGLAEVLGVRGPDGLGEHARPRRRRIHASGGDREELLVDLLNELLTLHETQDAAIAGIEVRALTGTELDARIELTPLGTAPEGIPVKGATFHRLRVDERPDGRTEVRVYLDV